MKDEIKFIYDNSGHSQVTIKNKGVFRFTKESEEVVIALIEELKLIQTQHQSVVDALKLTLKGTLKHIRDLMLAQNDLKLNRR